MTDTIEPTEAQKQAAHLWLESTPHAPVNAASEKALACFLAEREHKLRESYVRIGVSTGQAERDALRAERDANIRLRVASEDRAHMLQWLADIARDTLRADLARANDERVRANGYLLAAQKSEMAMKGQLADARARVAELDASLKEAEHSNSVSFARVRVLIDECNENREREAAHLAHIKALRRDFAEVLRISDRDHIAWSRARGTMTDTAHYDDAKVPCQNTTTDSAGRSTCLLALGHDGLCEWSPRRKHYDDAKADAPAVVDDTEGGEG